MVGLQSCWSILQDSSKATTTATSLRHGPLWKSGGGGRREHCTKPSKPCSLQDSLSKRGKAAGIAVHSMLLLGKPSTSAAVNWTSGQQKDQVPSTFSPGPIHNEKQNPYPLSVLNYPLYVPVRPKLSRTPGELPSMRTSPHIFGPTITRYAYPFIDYQGPWPFKLTIQPQKAR